MSRSIAFFDFDGTITSKDTLLEFIKFSKGRLSFYLGMLLNLHYLIGLKLGLVSNQAAKEKILRFFFSGTSAVTFQELCIAFYNNRLPQLIRKGALTEINKLKERGTLVVVVSASPENWIGHWAQEMQVDVIASRLEVVDGTITGKISGKNCNGKEKVRRILEKHVMNDYAEVLVYGDTNGDRPMMELATTSYFKPFRNKETWSK